MATHLEAILIGMIVAMGVGTVSVILPRVFNSVRASEDLAIKVLVEQSGVLKDLSEIEKGVTYLKEDRLKELGQRVAMKGQLLDTQKALDVLNTSLLHMADLEAKLSDAQKEIFTLKTENKELRDALLHERDDDELEPVY